MRLAHPPYTHLTRGEAAAAGSARLRACLSTSLRAIASPRACVGSTPRAALGRRGPAFPLRTATLFVLAVLLVLGSFGRAYAQDAATPTADQPTPATLTEYQAALKAAQAALEQGQGEQGNAQQAVDAARTVLAAVRRVELPSGAIVEVEPLLGAAGKPLETAAAQARVQAMLRQLEAAAQDNAEARLAALTAVLEGPAFQQTDSLWDRFRRWVGEWWDRLFPQRAGNATLSAANRRTGELVAWVIGLVGIAAIVALLVYWLRGFLGNLVASAEVDPANGDGDDLPQTPAEARQRAASQAQTGNYRAAVRSLYLSALLTLEEHGLVAADRSLTNRELLQRLGPQHPVRPHMQPVVETFDQVWYGMREPDAQTYGEYTQSIDQLERIAAQADAQAGSQPGTAPGQPPNGGARP